jgi:ABC-2 type transport system ATP-binding protein
MTKTAAARPRDGSDTRTRIEAQGLCKRYGTVVAVENLSFSVSSGEILGLLGPNGAGKSTALRMLIGFQYPDSGRVLLGRRDVFQDGPAARARLGYLPESVPLYGEMTVRSYLEFFARLKEISDPGEIARVVERLDLHQVIERPCGNLSRGYRQRVGLAQAILGDPAVIILDEPTSGLDPNQIHDFRALLRELGRERAVLLSTHILSEALEVCDRVLILNRGREVASGTPATLLKGVSPRWARLRIPGAVAADEAARFGLEREPGEGGEGTVYRVRRDLGRQESDALLRLAVERGWEILEWGTGAAGLEALFRRLTLGEQP